MSIFKPVITSSNLLQTITSVDGQLIAVYDTGELYIDKRNGTNIVRTKYCDVVVDTFNNIDNLVAPSLSKIYFATDTHQLLQLTYDTGNVKKWVELGGSSTQVVSNSNSTVSINLADNTIYNLTNNNITSITLTAASDLSYCTLCFTAGTSTTFTNPSGSTCIGDDCANGTFTPVSGRSYQIAVDVLNNSITLYVLAIVTNSGIITSSDTTVSLTLANDTIYRCTSDSLSSLTIAGLSTGFRYAAVTFTSPATATTFAMPATGYYCVGASCKNGTFTPKASMRYNLAIEDEGDRIAIYVMEAL